VLMDLHQRNQMNQEMMARNQEGMERNQEKMERNQEAMERNQETMERNQEEINLRKTMAESLLVVMANNPHAVMDYHGNGSRMIRAAAQTKLNLSAKMEKRQPVRMEPQKDHARINNLRFAQITMNHCAAMASHH